VPGYPRAACPSCGSEKLEEKTSAGRGVVHSFTTQYRSGGPGFKDDVPYTLVLVDLDEGFRALADLRDFAAESLAIGLRVEVFFDEAGPDLVLPRFRPSGKSSNRPANQGGTR
jgi:hypothetical protein